MSGKILFCSTSFSGKLGDAPTGSWVEEIAAPYFTFKEAGIQVDISSIKGGEIIFDPSSTSGPFLTAEADSFLKEFSNLIKATRAVGDFTDEELKTFDAIFIPGGHGIMFDGRESQELKHALEVAKSNGIVISAVCHGPCGLMSAIDPSTGESIVKGKRVCAFTNSEEKAVGKDGVIPYSLEDGLKEQGAAFECGPDWSSYVVTDGKLITGQNPQSSRAVAQAVVNAILPHAAIQHGKEEGFHARGHPVAKEHHHAYADKAKVEHPQV